MYKSIQICMRMHARTNMFMYSPCPTAHNHNSPIPLAVNLFSCSPNGDLKMWDMRALKVRPHSAACHFSRRTVASPSCSISAVFCSC